MIRSQTVVNQVGGIRLDAALLAAFPTTSRAFVREALRQGAVTVRLPSGVTLARPEKGMKLKGGESLTVAELCEAVDNLVVPQPGPLDIVFEDEALLAVNKPAGISVQPLSCHETGTLMNRVVARHPECRALGDVPLMAGALHRIDSGTSGLVLIARSAAAFAALRAQFAAQTVEKTYLALVEGAVAVGGTLENDLVHDPAAPSCRMIDLSSLRTATRSALRPLHAVTRFQPIGRLDDGGEERTLLEVTIFTGVTHQIRAQLAMAGMHIINDRHYGAFAIENMNGHALHALAVKFRHPLSGQAAEIRTPYPGWASR